MSDQKRPAIERVARWMIAGLVAFAVLYWLSLPETPEQKAANAQAVTIAQEVVAVTRQPAWETVEINRATRNRYELTIAYRYPPPSAEIAAGDIQLLIRALLAKLIRTGIAPPKNDIRITVSAEQKVSGETGKPLSRYFGSGFYNPDRDQIEYKGP